MLPRMACRRNAVTKNSRLNIEEGRLMCKCDLSILSQSRIEPVMMLVKEDYEVIVLLIR